MTFGSTSESKSDWLISSSSPRERLTAPFKAINSFASPSGWNIVTEKEQVEKTAFQRVSSLEEENEAATKQPALNQSKIDNHSSKGTTAFDPEKHWNITLQDIHDDENLTVYTRSATVG